MKPKNALRNFVKFMRNPRNRAIVIVASITALIALVLLYSLFVYIWYTTTEYTFFSDLVCPAGKIFYAGRCEWLY